MNRRSFFKVIAAIGASTALPTRLIEAAAIIPQGFSQVGLIRETTAYNLYKDMWVLRFDALFNGLDGTLTDNTQQYGIDMMISKEPSKEELKEYRITAKMALEKAMARDGWSWQQAIELRPIKNYSKPEWMA